METGDAVDAIDAVEAMVREAGLDHPRDDARRLLDLLIRLGAAPEEIAEAVRSQSVGGLALELALREGEARPFAEAVADAGLTFEEAATYWQALGFPAPTRDTPRLTEHGVAGLRLMAQAARDLLGAEQTLALARVVGTTTWRLAQAVVDTFRARFEAPQLAAGVPYSEVVERYVELSRFMLPPFLEAVASTTRGHLVNVAAGTWSIDAEGATAQRDVVIGFVDISGYTALSRTLSPPELARLIDDFERVVAEAMGAHGARVVKQLGDGALFVADEAAPACRAALDVLRLAQAAPLLPPLRVGLAAGMAVALHGDLFGDVVNLAARLVAAAPEGTVLAAPAVRDRAVGFRFEPVPAQRLKGLPTPETPFLLLGEDD